MKIKILGCSGAEFPGHHPPGFLVDGKILLDAGTLSGVLEEKGQRKIKSIFITHAHMDHIREIPFLADNNIIGGWGHTVHIFSILPVVRDIKKNLLNFKLWPDMTVLPTAHDAVIQLHSLPPERPYKTMDYTVTPYRVRHSVPAVGYLVEDRKGRRFFYTGDTGQMDSTWKRVGETALHGLIIETSFPNRMEGIARMTGHLTPLLLREELKKIRIPPERILITHLKPQFYRVIQAELKALRLKNLRLLKEGETITL